MAENPLGDRITMPPRIRVVNDAIGSKFRHWPRQIFLWIASVHVGFAVVVASKIPLVKGTIYDFMSVLARCLLVLVLSANLSARRWRRMPPAPLLIAYGGHNETMVPMWVGIEKGMFRKYGVDPSVLQTRSGPIMMATLASGGVPLVWAAPSSALNSSVSGFKLTCFAAGNNRIPRELIVRKGIESLEDLRGKSFGVQSIGGGFWLSTMGSSGGARIDADKYKLNMRVLGDTGTVTQALVTGNIDAMVVPYSYADMAKRAGARSLADVGTVNMVFQLTVMCAPKDSAAVNHETMINLTKGVIESSCSFSIRRTSATLPLHSRKISA